MGMHLSVLVLVTRVIARLELELDRYHTGTQLLVV